MSKDKKKPKVPYTDYYMSAHMGICMGPIDYVWRIEVKDEVAWEGHAVEGTFRINEPDLFGGNEKEGGVVGDVHIMLGNDTQILPPHLAAREGMAPDNAIAYRNLAGMFFTGDGPRSNDETDETIGTSFFDEGGAYSGGGFLWSQNNPYQPAFSSGVTRLGQTDLDPAFRVIQWTGTIRVEQPKNGGEDGETEFVEKTPEPDANPAWMIFECLTNPIWGGGIPTSLIDYPSFNYAAELFFNEGMGLSMMFTGQADIESFVQEIADHVVASVFLNPRTGLYEIKPFREDYDVETIRVVNESNSQIKGRGRKALGEIVNEIVVTWTNPFTEETETLTFHDNGQIAAQQGQIVSDTRNYYGFRNPEVTTRAGLRDIAAAAVPLFTASIEGDHTFWDVVPGEVLKVDIAEDGITGLICRVTDVDRGKADAATTTFSVIEEIFSLGGAEYYDAVQSSWVSPNKQPTDMPFYANWTIPLSMLIVNGAAPADDDYPVVGIGFLGAHYNTADFSAFEAYAPQIQPNGSTAVKRVGSYTETAKTNLTTALVAEAQTVITGFGSMFGQVAFPKVNDFMLMMDPANPDTISEMCLIAAVDTLAGEITVDRGIFDTIPREWPIGTAVWFPSFTYTGADPNERTAGSLVSYNIRVRTSLGIQTAGEGNDVTFTPTERPYLPIRPAAPTVGGHGAFDARFKYDPTPATLPMTWVNRNRYTEDNIIPKWTDATTAPEAGQTTTVKVRSNDTNAIIATQAGLTGTGGTLTITEPMKAARDINVEFYAVRDGFESLQAPAVKLEVVGEQGYGNAYGFGYGSN